MDNVQNAKVFSPKKDVVELGILKKFLTDIQGSYVNLSARYSINFSHYSSSITISFGVVFFFEAPNISLVSQFPEALLATAFFFLLTGAGVFTNGVTS